MYIFYRDVQKRQQYDDRFLLISGDIIDDRQIVNIVQHEDFLELEDDQDHELGGIALACVQDAGDSVDSLLYLYFSQPAVRMTVSWENSLANSVSIYS